MRLNISTIRIHFVIFIFLAVILYLSLKRLHLPKKYMPSSKEILALIDTIIASDNVNTPYFYDNESTSFPLSSRIKAKKIFHVKPLVIWSTETHMTPIKDIADILSPFGVKVIDYNVDPWRCEWHDCTKQKNLKVLNSDTVMNIDEDVRKRFYEAYKNDTEMRSVDVVYCGYPVGVCELYEQLNKSVLVVATTRYDVGRHTPEAWNKINKALIRFSKKRQNIIGGNSFYDAKYIQYYTGIKTKVLQSFCDYTGSQYTNRIPIYLVLRRRDNGFNNIFFSEFRRICKESNCKIKLHLITEYTYESLSSYRGIVHVPYQLSAMSIYEQYRMNIPMFFPTIELLAQWQLEHFLMPERTFEGAFRGIRPNASIIPPHLSHKDIPDPKNEWDFDAILYWIQFADFYQETIMPHVFYYNSITNLIHILETIPDKTLWETSRQMEMHNLKTKMQMLTKWKKILINYADSSSNKPPHL